MINLPLIKLTNLNKSPKIIRSSPSTTTINWNKTHLIRSKIMKHIASSIDLFAGSIKPSASTKSTPIIKVKPACSINSLLGKLNRLSLLTRLREILGKCLKGFFTLQKGFALLVRSLSTMVSKRKSFTISQNKKSLTKNQLCPAVIRYSDKTALNPISISKTSVI